MLCECLCGSEIRTNFLASLVLSLTYKSLRISKVPEMPVRVNFIGGVTILDVFRGCWALKGGEENQPLHLMTDVIRLIYSGGVRNGKEGERAVGRRTWPHLWSPEKCSAHNVVPCLLPSPVAALLLQPWPSLGVQLCSCHPSFLRKILPPPL